jgi:hypothetical protein
MHGYTVPSQWSGAGRSDGVDIGSASRTLSVKSEALGGKNDTDAFQVTAVG